MSAWYDRPEARAVIGPPPEVHTGEPGCSCWGCKARTATGDPKAAAASEGVRRATPMRRVLSVRPDPRLSMGTSKLRWRAEVERLEADAERLAVWERDFLLRPPPLRRPVG